MDEPALIIVADDYGRSPAYDAGILEAARAGAVDAVGAMVRREVDPAALLGTGVEIGLHLELAGWSGKGAADQSAGPAEREEAAATLRGQLERFYEAFGRPPAYVDGHQHCHAVPGLAATFAGEAARLRLPMRSVSPDHRATLHRLGVRTPDRLVGRLSEDAPGIPAELRGLIAAAGGLPPGITEWMVHPGRRDPSAASAYDAGREEDLRLLLDLAGRADLAKVRRTHAQALR